MKRIIVSLSLVIGLMLALQTVLFAEGVWEVVRIEDWETDFQDVSFVDQNTGWAVTPAMWISLMPIMVG